MDCIRLTAQMEDQQFNTTFCMYIKQYPLPEKYFVTICSFQGEIRIDFRKFINNYPTIQGVYLNTRQWNYFKRLKQAAGSLFWSFMLTLRYIKDYSM
jgi:hypothetical protein